MNSLNSRVNKSFFHEGSSVWAAMIVLVLLTYQKPLDGSWSIPFVIVAGILLAITGYRTMPHAESALVWLAFEVILGLLGMGLIAVLAKANMPIALYLFFAGALGLSMLVILLGPEYKKPLGSYILRMGPTVGIIGVLIYVARIISIGHTPWWLLFTVASLFAAARLRRLGLEDEKIEGSKS